MLEPMHTYHPHLVTTLPWLTTLAIAAAIAWAMTALLVGAPSFTLPAESVPIRAETFTISRACDPGDNWQLTYARTTGRIPANYCPLAR
jgi:hypothetical protein